MGNLYIMEKEGNFYRVLSNKKEKLAERFGYRLIETIFGKNVSTSNMTELISARELNKQRR